MTFPKLSQRDSISLSHNPRRRIVTRLNRNPQQTPTTNLISRLLLLGYYWDMSVGSNNNNTRKQFFFLLRQCFRFLEERKAIEKTLSFSKTCKNEKLNLIFTTCINLYKKQKFTLPTLAKPCIPCHKRKKIFFHTPFDNQGKLMTFISLSIAKYVFLFCTKMCLDSFQTI